MPIVNVPNVGPVNFPDGMSDADIVKAIETPSEWDSLHYSYLSTTDGEITPKLFFLGLNEGTSVFNSSIEIIAYIMQKIGFPDFQ